MPIIWLAPASQWAQSSPCSKEDDKHNRQCGGPCCISEGSHMTSAPAATTLSRTPASLSKTSPSLSPTLTAESALDLQGAACPTPDHDPDVAGQTVLVVLPGGSGRRRLLRSMRAAGARLVCYAGAHTAALAAHVDEQDWILGPADDVAAALASVRAWLSAPDQPGDAPRHIHATLCYNEFGLELCAYLAEGLGAAQSTAMPLWAAEAARSKRALRRACASADLPTPRFLRLTAPEATRTPEQLLAVLHAASMDLPVVVKPSSCAGSFSVLRADTLPQLADAVQGFWARLPTYLSESKLGNRSLAATDGLLIEELLQGQEVDIDCLVFKGQLLFAAISDNHPCRVGGQVSAFVEAGGCCPSLLPDSAQEQLLSLTASVVGLFGTALSGALHFEAMYCRRRQLALPIELNARIGGGETFTNVLAAWGVDLAHAVLRIACGLRPLLPPHLRPYAVSAAAPPGQGADSIGSRSPAADPEPPRATACTGPEQLQEPTRAGTGLTSSSCCQAATDAAAEQLPQPCFPGPSPLMHSKGSSTASSSREEVDGCSGCLGGRGMSRPEGCPWALWTLLEAAPAAVCRCSALTGPLVGCRCRGGGCSRGLGSAASDVHASDGPSGRRGRCGGPGAEAAAIDGAGGVQPSGACSALGNGGGGSGSEGEAAKAGGRPHGCCSAGGEDTGQCGMVEAQNAGQEVVQAQDWRRCVPPLRWVDSINFVPEWTGAGVVDRAEVGAEAHADPAFVDCELYVAPGDVVAMPPLGFSALGWLVVQGAGPEEAGQAMCRALRHVCIELREPM